MTVFFSIGMSKSEVISKLDSTQSTEKTKQYIKNFWNTDRDGKITNEIENAMLNSWASGSEKVKMPTQGVLKSSETKLNNGGVVHKYQSHSGNKYTLTVWDNRESFIMYGNKKISTPDMTVIWSGNGQDDRLFDRDGDGYADLRECYPGESVNPEFEDAKMDGNLNKI